MWKESNIWEHVIFILSSLCSCAEMTGLGGRRVVYEKGGWACEKEKFLIDGSWRLHRDRFLLLLAGGDFSMFLCVSRENVGDIDF